MSHPRFRNNLCDRCQSYFHRIDLGFNSGLSPATWDDFLKSSVALPSLKELKSSATDPSNECHFCMIMARYIQQSFSNFSVKEEDVSTCQLSVELETTSITEKGKTQTKDDYYLDIRYMTTIGICLAMVAKLTGGNEQSPRPEAHDNIMERHQSRPCQHISTTTCDSSTSSRTAFHQIRTWLNVCTGYHLGCHRPLPWTSGVTSLPLRLVEIVSTQEIAFVRLVDVEQLPECPRYGTLSYCWGKVPFHRTKTQNLAASRVHISLSSLPQTFQDAILLLSELGFEYLWVDALCIIQDDLHDWAQEAAKMSDIYARSSLNIAATGAEDVHGGLYHTRRPLDVLSCHIVPTWEWLPREGPVTIYPLELSDFSGTAPLHRRGWAIQERYLAPRTVHFASEQVYWECRLNMASETRPNGLVLQDHASLPESFSFKKMTLSPNSPLGDNLIHKAFGEGFEYWAIIVSEYSRAKLTYSTDKLVALAGLARALTAVFKHSLGRYLAGLWETSLLNQLGWFISADEDPGRVYQGTSQGSATYRAPSWSWAAADGPVYLNPRALQELKIVHIAQLLEVQTTASPDEYSSVSAAYLKLRAPQLRILHAEDSITIGSKILPILEQIENSLLSLVLWTLTMDCGERSEKGLLQVLPLWYGEHRSVDDYGHACCLVIEPTGVTLYQYRRVGVLYLEQMEAVRALTDELGIPSTDENAFEAEGLRGVVDIELV